MGNWAAAASDAAKACAGARPYSMEEVSVPRFMMPVMPLGFGGL